MPRSAARTVGCAVLLASVEVHAFLAKAPLRFAAPPLPRAGARAATRMSAELSSRRSLAGAMGVAASLATAASAAPVGPWALSEFLDAVEKDSVERVTFDDAGKALVAVDADGGRHRVEILPSEGPEILSALRKHNVQFAVQPPTEDPLKGAGSVVGNLLFPLLFLGGLFLLNRRNGGGGMGGMGEYVYVNAFVCRAASRSRLTDWNRIARSLLPSRYLTWPLRSATIRHFRSATSTAPTRYNRSQLLVFLPPWWTRGGDWFRSQPGAGSGTTTT